MDSVNTNENNHHQINDSFKNDIKSIIGPLVLNIDKSIINTQQSQQELAEEIDRLTKELETFTDMAGPPQVQNALEKLAGAKKKLANSIQLLQQTNVRVDRIQEILNNAS
ncbi:unnamed protein product [Cunninghamella blakesleeana]